MAPGPGYERIAPSLEWESNLYAKHGMPVDEIVGHVYVFLSAGPIRHYVGWTQQRLPRQRINKHGPAALREIVYLEPGTTRDESASKRTGMCPNERFTH